MGILKFISRNLQFSPEETKTQISLPIEPTSGGLLEVKVKFVIDGDTIIVSNSVVDRTIRLDSIDCPEDGQPGGLEAKGFLIELISGRNVYLEPHGYDKYGRILATVYVMVDSELININERLVVCGHAWVMRVYYDHLSKGRQRQFNRLERWAQQKRVGLWRSDFPIPPWEWRK